MSRARLRHKIVNRADLDVAARARMLELMRLCYENVDAERFASDLDNKQQVILLVAGDVILGFSTVRYATEMLRGKPVDILFSGDTVVHPDAWGAKALQYGFLELTVRHKLRRPWRPLYWLLLSKGYKTYLLLTNNFPTAFPRRAAVSAVTAGSAQARDVPADLRALRDRVASAWWPREYDPATEIVRYAEARDRVKNGVAPIDPETLARPDVAYFVQKNPGWADGDELVCFAEIDFALGARWFKKEARRAFTRDDARALSPTT